MITRTINKILKSLNNLPAEYKVALARILTGMIEGIDYLNKEKVDKEEGKGLSTNDFTDNLKNKLNHIEDGAQKNVKSDWNAIEGDSVILNKPNISLYPDSAIWNSTTKQIQFKHNGTILPQMTISGANFIKDGMVDSITIENNNLIITFNTDAGKQPIIIPLAKIFSPDNYYIKTEIDNLLNQKQNSLISGTNIKTINNESILGRGNIITEIINNKVTSISEQSTDEQYPSAKLLYDMLFEKLVVFVNVISGGTIEDVIGTNVTVFDNDNNVIIATKKFQGDPLTFRIKAGINYTLYGENIEIFKPPVSVNYKSELDSIRNYTIKYFDSPVINFVDPNVAAICINNWGNGEIITEKMAKDVINISDKFRNNTDIKVFNELRYFISLSTINSYAFKGCTELTDVILPDTLISIGNEAFQGCTKLTNVILPDSLTNIGYSVFNGCNNLQIELNLPNLTDAIYINTFIYTKITKILSLGSITSIGADAFKGCTELTDVIFPDTLTSIGNEAFQNCTKLTNVILPDSLTNIGYSVFNGCTALITFVINAIVPPTITNINTIPNNTNLKIYVPYSLDHSILVEYQGATNWNTFASKMYELDENGNIPV